MSSNNNYYEFKDAKVAIAMELVKRGWKLYGFHEDESDWMTDYWSPAWWEGIATKDGHLTACFSSHSALKAPYLTPSELITRLARPMSSPTD